MNTERVIVLQNVADQPIGLKDTQGRTYRLGVGAKVRISQASLQDILDYPASKIIFNEDMVKVGNVDAETLYNMGLTDEEVDKFTLEDVKAAVVITKDISKPTNEEIVIPVEKPKTSITVNKTTTTKKPATKKSSSSKSSK